MSTHHHDDEHDLGLQHDLLVLARQQLGRRQALNWLVTAGSGALLVGCGADSGTTASTTTTAAATTTTTTGTATTTTGGTTTTTTTGSSSAACVADPEETAGPYPGDGSNSANGSVVNVLPVTGIVRQDIRTSIGGAGGTATGVLLTLKIRLVNTRSSCAVLPNYAVYLWHCDAQGRYSMYDLPNENYLRGVQTTDANGELTFVTIVPGCYAGRFPHMHFEVYPSLSSTTSYRNKLLTSQIAIPADVTSAVYAGSGYGNSATNASRVTLASDGIFGDNSAAQIAAQTPVLTGSTTAGYSGTLTIGLAV